MTCRGALQFHPGFIHATLTVRSHRPSVHTARHLRSHAPLPALAPRTQALCPRMLPHPFTATWRMLFRLRLTASYDSCSSGECRKFPLCGHTCVLGIADCVGGYGELGVGISGLGARSVRLLCAVKARGTLAPPLVPSACLPPHRRRHLVVIAFPRIVAFSLLPFCLPSACSVRPRCVGFCAAAPFHLGSRSVNKSPCRSWLTSVRHSPAQVSLAAKHRRDRGFSGKRSKS